MNKELSQINKLANTPLGELTDSEMEVLKNFILGAINQNGKTLGKVSEFVATQRAAVQSCVDSYEGDDWLPIGLQRLIDACDIIDNLQTENEDLIDCLRSISGTPRTFPEMCCAMNRARIVLEECRKNIPLTIEKLRLIQLIKDIEDWATVDFNEELLKFIAAVKKDRGITL